MNRHPKPAAPTRRAHKTHPAAPKDPTPTGARAGAVGPPARRPRRGGPAAPPSVHAARALSAPRARVSGAEVTLLRDLKVTASGAPRPLWRRAPAALPPPLPPAPAAAPRNPATRRVAISAARRGSGCKSDTAVAPKATLRWREGGMSGRWRQGACLLEVQALGIERCEQRALLLRARRRRGAQRRREGEGGREGTVETRVGATVGKGWEREGVAER